MAINTTAAATSSDIKARILQIVTIRKGLKASHLLSVITMDFQHTEKSILRKCLLDLLVKGEIEEIEIIYPDRSNEGFLVPVGTQFRAKGI